MPPIHLTHYIEYDKYKYSNSYLNFYSEREVLNVKKRLLSILICLCIALTLLFALTIPAQAETMVTNINVGLEKYPVAGDPIPTKLTSPSGVVVSNVKWYPNHVNYGNFHDYTEYSIQVTLTPGAGYTFGKDTKTPVIHGLPMDVITKTDTQIVAKRAFPRTGAYPQVIRGPIYLTGLTPPRTGQMPDWSLDPQPASSHVLVDEITWRAVDTVWNPVTPFLPHVQYSSYIHLYAATDYYFDADIQIYLDGNLMPKGNIQMNMSHQKSLVLGNHFIYTFDDPDILPIRTVKLGMEAPVAGKAPDTTVDYFTASGGSPTMGTGTPTWSPAINSGFAPNTVYTVSVPLSAPNGYQFFSHYVYINGNLMTFKASNDRKTGTATYTFPATGSGKVTLDGVFFTGLKEPASGQAPSTNITVPPGIAVIDKYWSPSPGSSFAQGTTYSFYVEFKVIAGYTLPNDARIFLNYREMSLSGTDGETFLYRYTFPATEASEQYDIKVSYNKTAVDAALAEAVTLTATHNITSAQLGTVKYQWMSNTTNIVGTAKTIPGATSASFTVPTGTVGTTYYFCEVSNTKNGKTVSSFSDSATLVKVTVTNDEYDITVSYNKTAVDVAVGDTVSLSATHNIPSDKIGAVKFQWYLNATDAGHTATPISGATSSSYSAPINAVGTSYYFCEITNTKGDKTVSSITSGVTFVRVTVSEEEYYITVSYNKYTIDAKKGDTVSLTATHDIPSDKLGEVSYQWYSNNTNYIGTATKVTGATSKTYNVPTAVEGVSYYFCEITNVKDGKTTSSFGEGMDIVKVTVSDGKYVFPFADVPTDAWYYNNVLIAHKNGLVNGKTETEFMPNDNMTVAEAIKLAACMHQLYYDGEVTLVNGKPEWYSTYMDYALANNIIEFDYSLDANKTITRQEYIYIFYKALPESEYTAINFVADNAIPDVKFMSTAQFPPRIYAFYRAGILEGSGDERNFLPHDNIRRCEVAAILTRMFDHSERKTFTLG